MSSDGRQSDLNSFCGMWKKESKNGVVYLQSMLTMEKHGDAIRQLLKELETGNVNLMAFKTKEKKTERSPDWSLSFSKMAQAKPVQPAQAAPTTTQGDPDDIPF